MTRASGSSRTLARRIAAAALLAAATALANTGLLAIARAIPGGEWDIEYYDHCIAAGFPVTQCCIESGGDWTGKYFGDPAGKCVAPAPLESQPGQSVAPPVLQNLPAQTSPKSPVITVPRGPNSGYPGLTAL